MQDLREKIELRMQILEQMMERNMHIKDPETVLQFFDRLNYCWSVLNEEDRDFIHGAQFALEEQMEWNVDGNTEEE